MLVSSVIRIQPCTCKGLGEQKRNTLKPTHNIFELIIQRQHSTVILIMTQLIGICNSNLSNTDGIILLNTVPLNIPTNCLSNDNISMQVLSTTALERMKLLREIVNTSETGSTQRKTTLRAVRSPTALNPVGCVETVRGGGGCRKGVGDEGDVERRSGRCL